jgi:hypothetical protein
MLNKMKKSLVLIAIALFALGAVGCSKEEKAPEPAAVEQTSGEGPKDSSAGGAASADMTPNVTEAEANARVGSKGGN